MDKKVKKIIGINLGIMVVYQLVIFVYTLDGSDSHASLGFMIISSFFLAIHSLILLITALGRSMNKATNKSGKSNSSKGYWISLLLILLLGFGFCTGLARVGF
ncbi:MAG: hypothetical protein WBG46_05285 [Nonlabens sp.]